MNTCFCEAKISDEKHYLCDACTQELKKGLFRMAGLGVDLGVTARKSDVMGGVRGGGGTATRVHAPDTVNDGAVVHKHKIEVSLKQWTRALIQDTTTLVKARRVNDEKRLEYIFDEDGEHIMVIDRKSVV